MNFPKHISTLFENDNEHIFFLGKVYKILDKGNMCETYLVISDAGVHFLTKDSLKKSRSCFWNNLIRINSERNELLNFEFNNYINLKFQTDNFDLILKTVDKIISYYFSSDELYERKLNVKKSVVSNNKTILSRFNSVLKSYDETISSESLEVFIECLRYGNNKFDTCPIDNKYIPFVYDCLILSDSVETIVLSFLEKEHVTPKLLKLLSSNINIKHICFQNMRSDDVFLNFITDLSVCDTKIEAITLNNMDLNVNALANIEKFASKKSISSISISESIIPSGLNYFNNDFFTQSLSQSLVLLSLSGVEKISVANILRNTHSLTFLALKRCCIDVFTTLNIVSDMTSHVKVLDLSGNVCNKNDDFVFPNIDTLICDGVEWTKDTFYIFVTKLFNANVYHVSISEIKTDNIYIVNSLEYMASLNPEKLKLQTFIWDNNYIDENIFMFLESCAYLNTISLSNVLNEQNSELFIGCLPSLKYLNNVVVRGNENNNLGTNSGKIITQLLDLQYLQHVDLTGNVTSSGVRHIDELAVKLKNVSKSIISIDNSPADIDSIIELGRKLYDLRIDNVAFPLGVYKQCASIEKRRELLSLWQSMYTYEKREGDSISEFYDSDFNVLIFTRLNLFPEYASGNYDYTLNSEIELEKEIIRITSKSRNIFTMDLDCENRSSTSEDEVLTFYQMHNKKPPFDSVESDTKVASDIVKRHSNSCSSSSNDNNQRTSSRLNMVQDFGSEFGDENQVIWKYHIPLVPPVNNSSELNPIKDRYTFPNLLKKIKRN